MADSMRAALEQAYTDLEKESEGTVTSESSTPVETVETLPESTDKTKTEKPVVGDKTEETVVGDEKPVVEDKKEPKRFSRPGEKPKPTPEVKPTPSQFKAPQSWKPASREHWDKIPVAAQEEITRREAEVSRALSGTASARKFAEEFTGVVRPFEGMIRASGVTPIQAVQNLMVTAASLQTGTPAQKAGLVANLIKTYGVDIAMLDQVLAGQKPKDGGVPDALLQSIRGELKPVHEFISQVRGSKAEQEQRLAQESMQTVEQFYADPKNEFAADLREEMADIIDLATNRGRAITLAEAYKIAVAANPEVSKLVEQRAAAKRTAEQARNVDRSRRAASSQAPGAPGGGVSDGKPTGRLAAISQAWDDLSR